MTGTSGLLRKTATDTWSLDTASYLTGNQSISLTGDITGSGATSISTTIANNAVTTAKIADANVTAAKLASGAAVSNIGFTPYNATNPNGYINQTTTDALYQPVNTNLTSISGHAGGSAGLVRRNANNTYTLDSSSYLTAIADGSVTEAKIADGAVTNAKLGTGSVTNGKLADLSITEGKIQNSAVSLGKIANIGTLTILGNNTGVSAAPIALTATQGRTVLGLGTAATANSSDFAPAFTSQTAGSFYAAPAASVGLPTFRFITNSDLPNSGVSANTYNNVTVNSKGIVTGGSNVSYLTSVPNLQSVCNVGNSTTTGLTVGADGVTVNSNITFGAYSTTRSSIYQDSLSGLNISTVGGSMYGLLWTGSLGQSMIVQETNGTLRINQDGHTTTIGIGGQRTTFSGGNITTQGNFIKSGGTSSQFLKADGSVDSNTYLTASTGVTQLNLGLITGGGTGFMSVGSLNGSVNVSVLNPLTASLTGPNALLIEMMTQPSLTAGTYNNVTVNNKGVVTSASNVAYLTGYLPTDIATSATISAAAVTGGAEITVNYATKNVASGTIGGGATSVSLLGGSAITVTRSSNTVTIANSGVTSVAQGTGITVSAGTGAVTITNSGVTSITGTSNQVTASASTGGVTLSLPQSINTTANVAFGALDIGSPNPAFGTPTSGEIRAAGNITAYATSDERLKTNIVKIDNALEKVSQIDGIIYDWNDEYKKDHGGVDGYFLRDQNSGVIAQQVEKVFPNVVGERSDGMKAVRYELLVPLLIEAIKDLKAEIESLKANK